MELGRDAHLGLPGRRPLPDPPGWLSLLPRTAMPSALNGKNGLVLVPSAVLPSDEAPNPADGRR